MGGFITKEGEPNQNIIQEFKSIKLESCYEFRKAYSVHFTNVNLICEEEFIKLFAELLNMTDEVFMQMKNNTEQIDIFEIYSTIVIFAQGNFSDRLKELFSLFDSEQSGQIDFSELVFTLQCILYGLCKLLRLKTPTLAEFNALSLRAKAAIDENENELIEYNEFFDWIITDQEIQQFLMKYLDYQTIENALNKFHTYYARYMNVFYQVCTSNKEEVKVEPQLEPKNSFSYSTEIFADPEAVSIHLSQQKDLTSSDHEMLMKFLTSSPIENSHITERHYADTIIAFSSFMATDIGGKHILENNQLQTLLHLTEGVEPTPERVKKELAKIDINKDGYVQIDEWLGYLSTCDPVTGVVYFDYELKQKFDQYDEDNSGSIDRNELIHMLRDTFWNITKDLEEEDKIHANILVEELANNIMSQLDFDHSKELEWDEFKMYMHTASLKEEELKQFIIKTYIK